VLGAVGLGTEEALGTEEEVRTGEDTDELVREVGGRIIVVVVEVVVVKLRVTGIAPLKGKLDVLEADEVDEADGLGDIDELGDVDEFRDIDELGDAAFAWLLPEEAVSLPEVGAVRGAVLVEVTAGVVLNGLIGREELKLDNGVEPDIELLGRPLLESVA
jgi:hypothetical protein